MTVGELLAAVPGLQAIGDVRIPSVVAAYVIAKAKRAANAELETIESQRIALCELHAERDEAGHPIKVDGKYQLNGSAAVFAEHWKELQGARVTLSGVRPVTLTELAGATLSPDVLFSLGPFVVEDAA